MNEILMEKAKHSREVILLWIAVDITIFIYIQLWSGDVVSSESSCGNGTIIYILCVKKTETTKFCNISRLHSNSPI